MTPRAVVFDFDGVIANSEPLHFRGFRDVLASEGIDLQEPDYYARYLGYDDVGAFRAIAADANRQWGEEVVARLVRNKAERMKELERGVSVLFPGAREAIERLAGICPIAIASGALRAEIVGILERESLAAHFTAVVAAEDTPASKPAPDPYRLAVTRLAAASAPALVPADCVAIEDSVWGLQSARAAGLRTIAITHTYPAEALAADADLVVDHLDALTWELLGSSLR
jgi:beta-phosphoglucomutase